MPWAVVKECYAESLAGTGMGRSALPGRVAFGSLIIKERLGTTDEETAEQIREKPYLQFFLGLLEFREDYLFDPLHDGTLSCPLRRGSPSTHQHRYH